MKETSKVRKIAFVGDHLPRKCGIATFTSDVLAAVAIAHPLSECLAVSVNDIVPVSVGNGGQCATGRTAAWAIVAT